MKRSRFRVTFRGLVRRWLSNAVRRAMLDNLDLVELVLRTRYAPAEFKRQLFGWDLDAELERARRAVWKSRSLSCPEYQELVRTIFESTRDYHAVTKFEYVETKTLPFSVKGARDSSGAMRYFTVYVEKGWEGRIPLDVELVRFGPDSAAVAVENLMKEICRSNEPSDRALATMVLTTRKADAGVRIPPEASVTVVLDSREPLTVPWTHDREVVPCRIALKGFLAPVDLTGIGVPLAMAKDLPDTYAPSSPSVGLQNLPTEPGAVEAARAVLGRTMLHPLYRSFESGDTDENPHGLRQKVSFFPPLGNLVWTATPDDTYYAYIYELGQWKIGFIRIADYILDPGQADARCAAFAKLISMMQTKTDALVIDQFNNPGGVVFHVYTLASMLSDKPLRVPLHKVTLDRHEVVHYAQVLTDMLRIKTADQATDYRGRIADALGGYPFTLKEVAQLRAYAEFILGEFERLSPRSLRVLTREAALWGIETLSPSTSAVYCKPVFVLVNELDFSGGDLFPAILQDSEAATIIGVRTAGAGGYVMAMSYFNPFGIGAFSITASLAIRRDGTALENKGVSPDVCVELSVNDLQHGYVDLVGKINATVSRELGGS